MKETSGNGYSKAEQLRLREASDRLCREYGLSVIEKLRNIQKWLTNKRSIWYTISCSHRRPHN